MKRNTVWANNLTLFQDTVAKAPDSLVVRLNLVSEYEKIGRGDLARAEYEEAIRINLLNVKFHIQWGQMHLKKGRIEKAIKEFKKAVQTNPEYLDAHRELAMVYEETGSIELAMKEWKEVMRIDPFHQGAQNALNRLQQREH